MVHAAEYDEIAEMSGDLCPDVTVPKTAGRWVSGVRDQMARAGERRSASAVDLVIAATAAHHCLTVLASGGECPGNLGRSRDH